MPMPTVTPALIAAQKKSALIRTAKKALTASDLVAIRCLKAGVAFPAEWQAYVSALRAIVNTGTGTLPARPAYPAGS